MSESVDVHRDAFRGLAIVPAFNEAQAIAQVLRELRLHAADFDIVVIDDGSADATSANARRVALELGRIAVVTLPFNLGIGGAMQTGYRYAARHHYDIAVQVDGDGQHPAAFIHTLIAHMQETKADFVIGSRFLQKDGYAQSRSRSMGIGVLRKLLRLLTGRTFTDCTSGFRAANKQVIEAFAHWYPDDYPEPEVVLLLHRAGFRIEEVPVIMNQRTTGTTSIPFLWGVFYIIKVGTALLLDMVRNPWPSDRPLDRHQSQPRAPVRQEKQS